MPGGEADLGLLVCRTLQRCFLPQHANVPSLWMPPAPRRTGGPFCNWGPDAIQKAGCGQLGPQEAIHSPVAEGGLEGG